MSAWIRWPLHRWVNNVGVSSSTRREAMLGGGFGDPNLTDLGKLRKFVTSLDKWPDNAAVTKRPGAVIGVEFFQHADPLTTNGEER